MPRVDLIQREERHGERDAVARRTRLEVIAERHVDASHRHPFREQIGRHARGFVAHQIVARQIQQAQFVLGPAALFHLVAIPALERRARVNALRQRLIVERENQLIVDEHVLASDDLCSSCSMSASSLRLCAKNPSFVVEFAFDKRAAR